VWELYRVVVRALNWAQCHHKVVVVCTFKNKTIHHKLYNSQQKEGKKSKKIYINERGNEKEEEEYLHIR
jgi:polysaccharide pyruvyl transferase WcaK-like protein